MDEDYLLISGIQHFCFCRRQWALIHIENYWDENQYTADGRIIHDRVHDDSHISIKKGVVTLRGLSVKSDRLRIRGQTDAVELIPADNGISLQNREGKWNIHPVEYKRGKPKDNDCDRLQLAAECICLEEMLSCRIEKGSVYYAQTRRREEVRIDNEIRTSLEEILGEMWSYYNRHYTPKVRRSTACKSCSLNNYCMPELERRDSVHNYIRNHILKDDV